MLLAALALTLPACGWTPADEQVLRKFFEESRLYDRTLLAAHGTVVFDPGTNGVVQQFEVLERGADQQIAPGYVRRQLTVRADVRSSEGRVEPKTLAVTLERRNDRWMVTAFR